MPPHYSLRLFCASSDHYRPTSAPYTASTAHIRNIAIPIEYPSNPDVSIDYQNVPFKQRGLRGKPGSAPPLDLGSSANGLSLNTGRMTSFVFGHTGPTSKKKEDWKVGTLNWTRSGALTIVQRFWFQIVLAEVHTKDELLSRLVKLNPTSAEDSIAEGVLPMFSASQRSLIKQPAKKRLEGDDIELGTSTMTLKDPVRPCVTMAECALTRYSSLTCASLARSGHRNARTSNALTRRGGSKVMPTIQCGSAPCATRSCSSTISSWTGQCCVLHLQLQLICF